MLVRTGVLPSAHCRRSPPRPSRRCAAATLAYLVTTTLMDQAYAPYSCSTKAKCNYHDCANRVCSSSNSNCQDNVWSYDCKLYDASSNKACKYDTAGSDNFCPDPSSCPAGTFSANGKNYLGDGACQPCNAGSYSSSPGAQSCTSCTSPPGSYCASGSNSTGGSLCPVGHFCAGSASDKQPCNAGSYSPSSGAHSCTPCVPGKFSLQSGANTLDACIACVAGKFSLQSGANTSDACVACGSGKFSTETGASACIACVAGKFSLQSGANTSDACIACVAGKFSLQSGANTSSFSS